MFEESSPERPLPFGDTEFLPKYNPNHFSMDYDLKLFKQIIWFWLDSPRSDAHDNFIKGCVDAVQNYAFCTGTLEGQIARLKGIYDIANGWNGKNKPLSVFKYIPPEIIKNAAGSKYEAFSNIFETYLPLNSPEDFMDGGFPGLFDAPSSFVNMVEGYDYLPSIGFNKMFGLPYIGKTKGAMIPEALALADAFFIRVAELIRRTPFEANSYVQGYKVPHIYARDPKADPDTAKHLKDLMNDFWYFGAGPLFPKAERYAQADIKKNIS